MIATSTHISLEGKGCLKKAHCIYDKAKDALGQNLAKKVIEDFASQSFEKVKINILIK